MLDHGRRTASIALKLSDTLADSEVTVLDRDVLHAAVLFYDIGEGNAYHNLAGARMVRDLVDGLCTPEETRRICQLVLDHPRRV